MQSIYRLKNVLSGEVYPLTKSSCIVGRDHDCEVKIDSAALSRNHASLQITGDGVLLKDLNSTNGTYVNNILIQSATLLSYTDIITIGSHRLVLLKPPASTGGKGVKSSDIAEDFAYLDSDDRTSSNTMIRSYFAKSMGVMTQNGSYEIKEDESIESLISRALHAKPFDSKRVPAVLIVKTSRRRGELIELKHPAGSDKEWAIGRSNLADVVLNDPTVSNLHGVISATNKGWVLCDNDSTNGVKINGNPLNGGEGTCKHGDIITIGGIELILYILQI